MNSPVTSISKACLRSRLRDRATDRRRAEQAEVDARDREAGVFARHREVAGRDQLAAGRRGDCPAPARSPAAAASGSPSSRACSGRRAGGNTARSARRASRAGRGRRRRPVPRPASTTTARTRARAPAARMPRPTAAAPLPTARCRRSAGSARRLRSRHRRSTTTDLSFALPLPRTLHSGLRLV